MCGIFACFGEDCDRAVCIANAHHQIHRGPDDFYCEAVQNGYFCFTRLNIMDRNITGRQPFICDNITMCTNGEIYNHKELEKQFEITPKGRSDCEFLPTLFKKLGIDMLKYIDGMFAIVAHDKETGNIFIARDHIGIIPLYWGTDDNNRLWIASELKCLSQCTKVSIFPPRMYYYGPPMMGETKQWYKMDWVPQVYNPLEEQMVLDQIYSAMYKSVEKMLPCDSPMGCLLSGGLDSSLVAAFARKILAPEIPLHTFTIGLDNAPDFKFARQVAKHLGSVHHEFTYTVQEGIDVIPQVIKHLETFNTTTIRASTPQYLLSKRVASWGFKMVMSGEGADEAWGGYLYFHYAPNTTEFKQETVDKLEELHYYDCLRTNKSMLASGIETRVPFLDTDLLNCAMSIPTEMKMPAFIKYNDRPIEKGVLRKACDRDDLLPEAVIWRQKEQFSDSVGYGWIDGLKDHVKKMGTTEEEWYKKIFLSYGYDPSTVPTGKTVACSTTRAVEWMPEGTSQDASGRSVAAVHEGNAKLDD